VRRSQVYEPLIALVSARGEDASCGRWSRQELGFNSGFTSSEKVSSFDGRGDPGWFTSRTEGLDRRLNTREIVRLGISVPSVPS
jgi:hypothetical protein